MQPIATLLVRGFFVGLIGFGLGLGVACDNKGSQNPSQGVEGSANCPRSKPRPGARCPRGESEFCVYRTGNGDYVCTCGGGKWGCGKK
ncbi:MAG: hypothetical protein R3A51_09050 [Nannocystaceae bacterium]|nr:hypothetical protein [Myxococcales bacterium]